MGIFDFLKKNRKVPAPASAPDKPAPTPAAKPQPAAPERPNIVFPVAGDEFTPKRLAAIQKQQPAWFWINENTGRTRCQSLEHCEGNSADAYFTPCRCAKCGYAVHLNHQPDFTCKACG